MASFFSRFSSQFCIFLTDNGSLRPEPVFEMRNLAKKIAAEVGHAVEPVSVLHSSGIPAEQLGGISAEIFEPALRQRAAAGIREFVVAPLFFGPSGALTDYLPKRVRAVRKDFPDLRVYLADCLAPLYSLDTMAGILADQVETTLAANALKRPAVVLVDHGTPAQPVNAVRNALAECLAARLGNQVSRVAAASMERREGATYDFNEPLMEGILQTPGFDSGPVVIAMLFLLPGRHAGPGGDIAAILATAEIRRPALRTFPTPLAGTHPGLVELLAERLEGPWQSL